MDRYLPWLVLKDVPGIGNHLYKRLMKKFGSPEKIFNAHENDLKEIKGVSLKAVKGIKNLKSSYKAEKELKTIQNSGFKIVSMNDSAYPSLLKEIPDPPPILTYLGTLDNSSPCISIVGSRKATRYGLDTTFKLSYDLCLSEFQIVSGMAMGIDTAAHKGAIAAKGKTIAVLGSGLARIYPRSNRKLFEDIACNGAVISEFGINAAPDARNFPIRNRIISGISTGTIVVEAAARSGSLITARLAAEQCREVFAVPGSINSFSSTGTHALLKQGAKLVENKMDVIEELHHMVHIETEHQKIQQGEKSMPGGLEHDKYQKAIFDILEPYPLHIDIIIEKSGLDSGGISAALLDLEIQGIIKQSPGKLFYIIDRSTTPTLKG